MNGKLLGQNISYLRKKKNMTQQELANKIGITREQLSNYETGKVKRISAMVISNVAIIFEVNIYDLENINLEMYVEV